MRDLSFGSGTRAVPSGARLLAEAFPTGREETRSGT